MVANFVMGKKKVVLHENNALIRIGPFSLKSEVGSDVINASKETITTTLGYSMNRNSKHLE